MCLSCQLFLVHVKQPVRYFVEEQWKQTKFQQSPQLLNDLLRLKLSVIKL